MANPFVYSRRINIYRPNAIAVAGGTNTATFIGTYSGQTEAGETLLYSNVPASIQWKSNDRRPTWPIPGDTMAPGAWNIYLFKDCGIQADGIHENDIIVSIATVNAIPDPLVSDVNADDKRFQVEAAYWHQLGWKIVARMLKA